MAYTHAEKLIRLVGKYSLLLQNSYLSHSYANKPKTSPTNVPFFQYRSRDNTIENCFFQISSLMHLHIYA